MNVFADAYSRYLSNNFNYINKTKQFQKYFKGSVISLTDPNFMSKILIAKKDEFPKYPYFLNAFVRTDYVDIVKIYESIMDNTDTLVDTMIGSSELAKKYSYDVIPNALDSFLAELYFQFSYISTSEDLYNYDLLVRSFISEDQYRNFFSDLYAPLYHSTDQIEGETAGLEDKSFLYEYMLYTCLYGIMNSTHTIYSSILRYLTFVNSYGVPTDRVDHVTMLADFQTFITNYSNNMSIDLSNIIAKSMYDFQNISKIMIENLITVIDSKITNVTTGMYKSFYNFYNLNTSLHPVNFLANNFIQQLNSFSTIDFVSEIYDDFSIVDEEITNLQIQEEIDEYVAFMGKITAAGLKNYLFLCFLYKFWPIKFLNVLQLSLKEYTENNIKTADDDVKTREEYSILFEWFANNYINYPNLKSFLDNNLAPTASIITYGIGTHAKFTFTPGATSIVCSDVDSFNAVNIHDYIYADGDSRGNSAHVMSKDLGTLTLTIESEYTGSIASADVDAYRYTLSTNYLSNITLNYQIAEFACVMYYIFVFDEYFKSDEYDTFIEELTEDVFVYLRDTGHVDYKFDWYAYHDVIHVYFKTYLRWKILDSSRRCILSTNTNASYKFTNGSPIVYCSNIESYNLVSDGDFIVSEHDLVGLAGQILSHSIVGSEYVLTLTAAYQGETTSDKLYEVAYTFKSTDVPLFNTLTQNFCNKLLPKIITNTTPDPAYDFNIVIYDEDSIHDFFNSFANSQSFVRSMHQFNENLMLSAVTRETIYSVLSDFV